MSNLLNIRLYGHEWEPAYFQHKGLRGWWLRTLNTLRYWLELKVQWHTLYILSKIAGADVDDIRAQFKADQHKQTDTWFEERGAANLALATPHDLMHRSSEALADEQTREMLARMTELNSRARRYTHGRRRFAVYDMPDEDHYAKANADAGTGAAAQTAGNHEGADAAAAV